MRWAFLGQVPYATALDLQERLREGLRANGERPMLLLLEHPSVITLGRSARPEHVLVSESERRRRGVELVQIARGGDVTYHGPGQLVGYPVRPVGRNLRGHVEAMVSCLIERLAGLGIQGSWKRDQPGVWCAGGKIAAIGVDARHGIAIHGFAVNVRTRLSDFQMIVPCGLAAPVTSIERMLAPAPAPSVEELARQVGPDLCRRYDGAAEEVSADEVLAARGAA